MVSLSVTVATAVVHAARSPRYQIRPQGAAGERWPVLRPVLREARHSRTGATESDTKREGTPCIAAGRDRLSLPRTRAGGARSRERIQSRQFRLIDLIAAVLLAVH